MCRASTDFLSVRKIPLKKRPAFGEDGTPLDEVEDVADDSAVQEAVERIRKIVLKDRSLYDKVCDSLFRDISLADHWCL